jgi:hypothetical protein
LSYAYIAIEIAIETVFVRTALLCNVFLSVYHNSYIILIKKVFCGSGFNTNLKFCDMILDIGANDERTS